MIQPFFTDLFKYQQLKFIQNAQFLPPVTFKKYIPAASLDKSILFPLTIGETVKLTVLYYGARRRKTGYFLFRLIWSYKQPLHTISLKKA